MNEVIVVNGVMEKDEVDKVTVANEVDEVIDEFVHSGTSL